MVRGRRKNFWGGRGQVRAFGILYKYAKRRLKRSSNLRKEFSRATLNKKTGKKVFLGKKGSNGCHHSHLSEKIGKKRVFHHVPWGLASQFKRETTEKRRPAVS